MVAGWVFNMATDDVALDTGPSVGAWFSGGQFQLLQSRQARNPVRWANDFWTDHWLEAPRLEVGGVGLATQSLQPSG